MVIVVGFLFSFSVLNDRLELANILLLRKFASINSGGRTQICIYWNNNSAVRIGNSTKFGHTQNITRTDFRSLGFTSYVIVLFHFILFSSKCSVFYPILLPPSLFGQRALD